MQPITPIEDLRIPVQRRIPRETIGYLDGGRLFHRFARTIVS